MNDAQAMTLAVLFTLVAAEYAEASVVVDKERSMHAPGIGALAPHLDYEAQPKLPPPINEMPPGGRQTFAMPSYQAWYEQHRAATQAAIDTTMHRNAALLDSLTKSQPATGGASTASPAATKIPSP